MRTSQTAAERATQGPLGVLLALTNEGALGIVFKPSRTSGGVNYGDVAQLGERCLRTAEVGGSNPLVSTKESMSRRSRQSRVRLDCVKGR